MPLDQVVSACRDLPELNRREFKLETNPSRISLRGEIDGTNAGKIFD